MNTLLSSDDVLALVENHFALDKINYCMFIERGCNDHYVIATQDKKYIFRVYLNNKYYIESLDAYRFELDLLDHLHECNAPVANAIRNTSGELLGVTSTTLGDRAFALFPYADGINLPGGSLTIKQCYEFGKTMAQIHLAANSLSTQYKRYKLDLKYLVDEPIRLITEGAAKKQTSGRDEDRINRGQSIIEKLQPLDALLDSINSIGTDGDEFGIIHADLHPGNLHFHGDTLTVFDFDHCAYGWRAYDLAIAQYFPKTLNDAIVKGYESLRPLSTQERECLSVFANIRNLWDVGDILAMLSVRQKPED